MQHSRLSSIAIKKISELKSGIQSIIAKADFSIVNAGYCTKVYEDINKGIDSIIQDIHQYYQFGVEVARFDHLIKAQYDTDKWEKIISTYVKRKKTINSDISYQIRRNEIGRIFIIIGTVIALFLLIGWLIKEPQLIRIYVLIVAVLIVGRSMYESSKKNLEVIYKQKSQLHKKNTDQFIQSLNNELIELTFETLGREIMECIPRMTDKFTDSLWAFKSDCEKILYAFERIPADIAVQTSSMLFESNFVDEMCRCADDPELDENLLNTKIKQYIEIRKPLLEKNIVDSYQNLCRKIIKDFVATITNNGKKIEGIGAISKGKIDETIAKALNISSGNLKLTESTEDITNAIIGAGIIGAGVLSGGAGVALVASGPIGWIAGAILGGTMLFKGKDTIKSILRSFGFGLDYRKMQEQFDQIKAQFADQIKASLASESKKMRSCLDSICEEIIRKLIVQQNDCTKKTAK